MVLASLFANRWVTDRPMTLVCLAMLGLALGISLLLVPVGIFGLVLWFAVIGLMLARWWPAPLPPAWDAGEAIPWPSREDIGPPPAEGAEAGTVEGSGREVSEQPLAESGDSEAPPEAGETQGQRRKKRKRRN